MAVYIPKKLENLHHSFFGKHNYKSNELDYVSR